MGRKDEVPDWELERILAEAMQDAGQATDGPPMKRRPGRPKGSPNKKPRSSKFRNKPRADERVAPDGSITHSPPPPEDTYTVPESDGGHVLPLGPSSLSKRKAPVVRTLQWVAANIANAEPDPHECPSAEAWGLLRWVRINPINEGEFWRTIYPKLVPTRNTMEASTKFDDDGADVVGFIDRIERQFKESAK